MPTQYAVVQFGDVTTGEYLNIGIFAWDTDPTANEVKSKFLSGLGINDIFLEDIIQNWLKTINNKEGLDHFIESCGSPHSSMQITPPRGSAESIDQLLEGVAKTFLVE